MKDISDLDLPDDLGYTNEHEWVKASGDTILVGITDYAQDQLGDIVFVEMPEVGDTFAQGDEFGTLESVKAVSEMYMPVNGEVVAISEELEDAPELVNESPYGKGWIIEVQPDDPDQIKKLMSATEYLEILKG